MKKYVTNIFGNRCTLALSKYLEALFFLFLNSQNHHITIYLHFQTRNLGHLDTMLAIVDGMAKDANRLCAFTVHLEGMKTNYQEAIE